MAELYLQADKLQCERDGRLLFADLSFELSSKQLLWVRGANGAGKTTLLRSLCGLGPTWGGTLHWCGELLQKSRWQMGQELLYLGHATGVKPSLSPLENLRWFTELRASFQLSEYAQALAAVELKGFEDTPCFQLSAGQQRRAALARLVLLNAKVWILDEPATALDVAGVELLASLIDQHCEAGGAVLFTSHQALPTKAAADEIHLDAYNG